MVKIGRRNQLYGKWVRLLLNPDNEKEIYLVLEKDKPMEEKHIRQFDNMFMGRDILLNIIPLIRHKNKQFKNPQEHRENLERNIVKPKKEKIKKKSKDEAEKDETKGEMLISPFFQIGD